MKKLNPKQGDIILSHNYGLFGWWVRVMTRSYWNHCSLYLGNNKVLDILGRGIRILDYTKYYKNKIDHKFIRVKGMTKYSIKKIVDYAKEFIGCPYNFLLPFAFSYKKGAYTCSNLIAKIFSDNGVIFHKKYLLISPANIDESDKTYDINNPPNKQKELEIAMRILTKLTNKYEITFEEMKTRLDKQKKEDTK